MMQWLLWFCINGKHAVIHKLISDHTVSESKLSSTKATATEEVKMDTNPAYQASAFDRQNINNALYASVTGKEDTGIYDDINDDYYTDILSGQNVKMTQNPAYTLQEDS